MRRILSLLLIALFFNAYAQQGHKIEFKIKGAENQQIILGYHKGKSLIPLDTTQADAKGYGVFQGKDKYVKGLYLIYFPKTQRYFDFIMGDDQTFYIETDTADLYGALKIKGSPDNEVFLEYQKFMEGLAKKVQDLEDKYKAAKTDQEKEKYRKQLEDINQKRIDYINKTVEKYPNLFVSKFLKAMIDVEPPKDLDDPLKRYLWMKEHYFDNFDLSDPAMLRTPFYEQKVDYYLDKIIVPHPDSLIIAVDYLLDKTQGNDELYKWMLIHLFNKFARSNLVTAENVYVHLAEIYIRDAYWSDKDFIDRLKTRIARKKNCLIGEKAPDFSVAVLPKDTVQIAQLRAALEEMKQKGLEIEKQYPDFNDRIPYLSDLLAQYMSNFQTYIDLYKIQADFVILWFMDPECSHCKKETPELYKVYTQELKDKGVVVLDIYLERNTDDWRRFSDHINKWFKFVEDHGFYADGWINGWNPFANVRYKYDINATPKVYLLDKDKKIIAKNIGVQQLKEIIEKYKAQDEK